LSLAFATYLNLPYVISWKTVLTDPDWLVLTNISGEGVVKSVPIELQSDSRFFRVMRVCN